VFRCPVEVSIHHQDGEWNCQISLRFEEESSPLVPMDDTRSDSGSVMNRQVPFGDRIYEKSAVELMLRRAQAAILNPTIPHDKFLTLNQDELNGYQTEEAFVQGTKKFSKDTICLEIQDPQGANILFVDLPGELR